MHATEYSKAINDAPCGDGCGPVVHSEARCRTLANPACPTLRTSHQRLGASSIQSVEFANCQAFGEMSRGCCQTGFAQLKARPRDDRVTAHGKPAQFSFHARFISLKDNGRSDEQQYPRQATWGKISTPGYYPKLHGWPDLVMEFSFAAGNDHFQRKFEGLLEPGYRRDIDKAYPAILFWYGTDLSTHIEEKVENFVSKMKCNVVVMSWNIGSLQDSGKMIDRRDLLYGKRPVAMGSDWTSDNRSLLAPSRQHRDDAELNTLVTWRNEQVAEFAVMAN
uniref:Uncharacterized protein n=1 Tax=Coccidioides posadasii RMSCC 3488 TaxID=454284 RepID=A0A0J6FKA9_COCPO|nr:hypothetical protein CPAG_06173 [Coccidioides posadasii RMSCC 3488]